VPAHAAVSWSRLTEKWPEGRVLENIAGIAVSWPSSSPFTPAQIDADPETNPPTAALGRLFLPPGNHAPRSAPAIVLLHGSGGVLPARELTYAAQLAAMGVAALVGDSFAARRDRGTEFLERVLNITETMMLAETYSGLAFLASRPEIDPRRVMLTGFFCGAMATVYALYQQVGFFPVLRRRGTDLSAARVLPGGRGGRV
jgi:dienelactone hydrolase